VSEEKTKEYLLKVDAYAGVYTYLSLGVCVCQWLTCSI